MPEKQFNTVESKGGDTGGKKANIFKLGQYIKRELYSFMPYDNYNDCMRFAEACLIFLEHKHPDKLKRLKFTAETDDLSFFIGQLANTITSGCLHYIIKNDAQDAIVRSDTDYKLEFLKSFDLDMHFYVLDVKSMWQLNEPLRIGYAHILDQAQRMSNYESDFFMEDYDSETILNGMDMNDIAEYLKKPKKEIKELFRHYRSEVEKFKVYAKKDIDIFLKYRPRSEQNKKIWECLHAIHTLSLKPFHKFADSCDHYEHGMSSYSDLLIAIIDNSDDYGKYYVEDIENNFNNTGVSYPAIVVGVDNNKIVEWHKDGDITEFYDLCKNLSNLMTLLNI